MTEQQNNTSNTPAAEFIWWRNQSDKSDTILEQAVAIADGKSNLMPTTAHLRALLNELRRQDKI